MPTTGYAVGMIPISFRAPDSELALDVTLANETVEPLMDQLRIVSPLLADKVDDARRESPHVVVLQKEEVELLAAAAHVVSKSHRVDDSELERLAQL